MALTATFMQVCHIVSGRRWRIKIETTRFMALMMGGYNGQSMARCKARLGDSCAEAETWGAYWAVIMSVVGKSYDSQWRIFCFLPLAACKNSGKNEIDAKLLFFRRPDFLRLGFPSVSFPLTNCCCSFNPPSSSFFQLSIYYFAIKSIIPHGYWWLSIASILGHNGRNSNHSQDPRQRYPSIPHCHTLSCQRSGFPGTFATGLSATSRHPGPALLYQRSDQRAMDDRR